MQELGTFPLFVSFTAGLLSFISPCILPLIPAYIVLITRISADELNNKENIKTILFKSLLFVSGFSLVFILLGLSATFIGSFLLKHIDIFRICGGIVVIIFGLHILNIFKISFLYKQTSFNSVGNRHYGYINIFLTGCAFAFGWTPCVGPILSSILVVASTSGQLLYGTMLLLIYSAGLAVPFILSALFINKLINFYNSLKKYYRYVEIFTGIILIITGIFIVTDGFSVITTFLLKFSF